MAVNTIPIEDAYPLEVCLRVAYRLVQLRWQRAVKCSAIDVNQAHPEPAELMAALIGELQAGRFTSLAYFVTVYAQSVKAGRRLRATRDDGILAARRHTPTRREYSLPSYKAHRRLPPRVTNRGGQDFQDVWSDPENNATLPDDLQGGISYGD